MSYNWKCCSFYPNNFDASALTFEYTNPEVLILQGFGEDIYVLLNF